MGRFHAGEIRVQSRLGVREDAERVGRIVAPGVTPPARAFLARQRIAVAASLDRRGRPWASLLTGPPGFVLPVDDRLLRISAASLDGTLAANLKRRHELALLVIDLGTRQRVRFNGRGLLSPEGLFLLAEAVYGNCPKYIQSRRVVGEDRGEPGETRRTLSLDSRQRARIAAADTFFIASWHPKGGADASHRGGRPGFVQVVDERTLVFPDYPGNNLFNTLGNLAGHPWAGLLFPDFENGTVLQIAGRAEVVWEPETAVRVGIEEVRETPSGNPLRLELVEPWPANPPVTPPAARHPNGKRGEGRTE